MKKTTKTAAGKTAGAKKKTTAGAEKKAAAPAEKKVAPKAPVKTVAKKEAPKPSTAAKPEATAPAVKKPAKKVTQIIAHVDVGWGHMLYIRGEGAGLSWEQGVPMICADNGKEWHWIAETEDGPISFKFLVDDISWSQGENVTINAGDTHLSDPIF